jgi:hypothetical protein
LKNWSTTWCKTKFSVQTIRNSLVYDLNFHLSRLHCMIIGYVIPRVTSANLSGKFDFHLSCLFHSSEVPFIHVDQFLQSLQ